MLMALERGMEENKWFSLIYKVWSEWTLGLAWEKVKANARACGVNGITIERFDKESQLRLLAVEEQLKRGNYQPKPVKRVWIDKPGSVEKRPLGIPTVLDRVLQAEVRMAIEPIFEKCFAKHSYGFRPRCGHQGILRCDTSPGTDGVVARAHCRREGFGINRRVPERRSH
jgi:RNA-directed DNA polymerase